MASSIDGRPIGPSAEMQGVVDIGYGYPTHQKVTTGTSAAVTLTSSTHFGLMLKAVTSTAYILWAASGTADADDMPIETTDGWVYFPFSGVGSFQVYAASAGQLHVIEINGE